MIDYCLNCHITEKAYSPLPNTLVILDAKSSGWGGKVDGGCCPVNVGGYEPQGEFSEGGGLNGFIGVIIKSLSATRTPWSFPCWSTS